MLEPHRPEESNEGSPSFERVQIAEPGIQGGPGRRASAPWQYPSPTRSQLARARCGVQQSEPSPLPIWRSFDEGSGARNCASLSQRSQATASVMRCNARIPRGTRTDTPAPPARNNGAQRTAPTTPSVEFPYPGVPTEDVLASAPLAPRTTPAQAHSDLAPVLGRGQPPADN